MRAKRSSSSPARLAKTLGTRLHKAGARQVVLLKMEDLLDYTDYFVIAHGLSLPHLKALAKQVKEASEDLGVRILHVEGYSGLRWMVFDFDSVMVHLFSEEARLYYGLESLWSDASRSMIGEDIVDC